MLIRRQEAAALRLLPLATSRPASAPVGAEVEADPMVARAPPEPQLPPHDETADLARRIEVLEDEVAKARAAAKRKAEDALAEGKEQGRREAETGEAERLAALEQALSAATANLAAAIDTQADLAVVIARAAIGKILGNASERAAMVEEVVRHAVGTLFAGDVIEARLSAADFPEPDGLAALGRAFAQVAFVRDGELPAGSCLLELTLGTVDASLGVQAAAVDAELRRLQATGAGA